VYWRRHIQSKQCCYSLRDNVYNSHITLSCDQVPIRLKPNVTFNRSRTSRCPMPADGGDVRWMQQHRCCNHMKKSSVMTSVVLTQISTEYTVAYHCMLPPPPAEVLIPQYCSAYIPTTNPFITIPDEEACFLQLPVCVICFLLERDYVTFGYSPSQCRLSVCL